VAAGGGGAGADGFLERGGGAFVAHDLAHDRLAGALEGFAVVDHVLARGAIALEQAVDLRDHVARDEVPALERVLAVGPVVGEADHRAKPAAELLQLADRGDQVVWRADDRGGAV
jgi:hypothetical protein